MVRLVEPVRLPRCVRELAKRWGLRPVLRLSRPLLIGPLQREVQLQARPAQLRTLSAPCGPPRLGPLVAQLDVEGMEPAALEQAAIQRGAGRRDVGLPEKQQRMEGKRPNF